MGKESDKGEEKLFGWGDSKWEMAVVHSVVGSGEVTTHNRKIA